MDQKKEQHTLTGAFAHGTDAQSAPRAVSQMDAYAGMMGYPYNVQVVSPHQKISKA